MICYYTHELFVRCYVLQYPVIAAATVIPILLINIHECTGTYFRYFLSVRAVDDAPNVLLINVKNPLDTFSRNIPV